MSQPQPPAVIVNPPEFPSIERPTLTYRLVNLLAVIIPFAGLITAIVLMWNRHFNLHQLIILATTYLLTVFGITIGFHRYFTHRSFEAPRWVQVVLAVLGSMAVQGPLLRWVATHRRHHQHSDTHEDPHSPNTHGGGVAGTLKGMWHAHMGWLFEGDAPGMARYATDLFKQRLWRVISALFPLWVALGLLAPAVAGGLIAGSWNGAMLGFIWGGLVRVFLVHHVTWSINSVCHLWGTRPYRSHDDSRNNVVFGVLALGEGWHNNHHAFPTSARHGLRWWQIDVSYYVIKVMSWCGLAWKVRLPSPQALAAKAQR